MMRLVKNPRNDGSDAISEYEIGSLPVASWIELYTLDDVLIYRGIIIRQSPWGGYASVQPVTEGDGNFIGSEEDESLRRLYKMNEHQYVQEACGCRWLGVDQELVEILTLTVEPGPGVVVEQVATYISLVPVVSLIPIDEVE